MKLIGITGGIATGKSTVSQILQERFLVPVIYVDKIARLVVEPGTKALEELVEAFGEEILQSDGYLNRKKLRSITVKDKAKMDQVTDIVWPAISAETSRMMNNFKELGARTVCVENAMLIEHGNHKLYDHLVVVTCDPDIQLKRVISRDNQSEEDARAIISLQMPMKEKEAFADFLIENDGDRSELYAQIEKLYESLIVN